MEGREEEAASVYRYGGTLLQKCEGTIGGPCRTRSASASASAAPAAAAASQGRTTQCMPRHSPHLDPRCVCCVVSYEVAKWSRHYLAGRTASAASASAASRRAVADDAAARAFSAAYGLADIARHVIGCYLTE